MPIAIQGRTLPGNGASATIDRLPSECPLCHFAIHPILHHAIADQAGTAAKMQVVLQCTREECQEGFFAYYDRKDENNVLHLSRCAPISPQKTAWDDTIKSISPNFVEIYDQATAAESYKLDQIAGVGLRKAIEFLIKDFLIHRIPNKKETIKETLLGACIKTFVDDEMLKKAASRAVWLGNDETHYVRKWENKDILDLKKLIKLTVLWIERIEHTAEFLRDMPEGGPSQPIPSAS